MSEPKTFNDLVAWATWEVIKSITKGDSLSSVMHGVLSYARQWKPSGDQP